MIDRVVKTIAEWGLNGYFESQADNDNFREDLKCILTNQMAAFNSPVWFNVGVYSKPQCSACFILSVEDNMESILEWYRNEGWIFKFGSGSGINLSNLRSTYDSLSRGGKSSGPVSFMKGADGVANSIRSGGTTRRAAKMVILNVDHPDIKDFIYCKKIIEDMTRVLELGGFTASIEGDLFNPYTLLPYQNANNSVRVTDEFMKQVEADGNWELKSVTTKKTVKVVKAREIMNWMIDAAWHCADPGIQFDTTINNWHTCPQSGRIEASNPCSEYMHTNDSACNLASINLLKFLNKAGEFMISLFKKVTDTMIMAQEIIVGNSSYPTEKITKNANAFRQLGLGYANLGSLLMNLGLPYDSNLGRAVAAAITSIMTAEAYKMSAKIASMMGSFEAFEMNKEAMFAVIKKHASAADRLSKGIYEDSDQIPGFSELISESASTWQEALKLGKQFGYRNAQATLLAPTGTIAFLMDCDTTGIEPELALVKYKKLVGGGTIKLVNTQISPALTSLGYKEEEVAEISKYILERETIEGAPNLKPEHLPIFDCSFKPQKGTRSINYLGHIKMMGAVQPFLSGAISKTVNLPNSATKEDFYEAYFQAWKYGLKSVAIYRDGCKTIQPLNTSDNGKKTVLAVEKIGSYNRVKLPDDRDSKTHKFSIAGHEGYLIVGLYPDTKKPGETFIVIAKEGSTISGLFDTIATLTSIALQSGVPLKTLVKKFKDMRFEPAGITSNPNIRFAKSFVDYIFRYLGITFLSEEDKKEIFGDSSHDGPQIPSSALVVEQMETIVDSPVCFSCGTIMNRTGSCYSCPNCFETTGVCN